MRDSGTERRVVPGRARARACRAGRCDRVDRRAALGDRPRALVAAVGGSAAARRNPRSSMRRSRQHRSRARGHRNRRPRYRAGARRLVAMGVRQPRRHRATPVSGGLRLDPVPLQKRPTYPQDVGPFVRTSILVAHLARLPQGRRDQFAADVVGGVRLPLDYVCLNVSAIRNPARHRTSNSPPASHSHGWGPVTGSEYRIGSAASCPTIPGSVLTVSNCLRRCPRSAVPFTRRRAITRPGR